VPSGAVFTDSVYTHPATHSIAEVSGLQTALDDASLSLWHDSSSQYIATSHIEFANCSQSINFALSPTAWTIDPTPPMANVAGLTAALAGKQAAITQNLTLGATAPLLTLAKGACQADWYIDGGNSTICHWDKLGSGSTYCGYKRAGGWQCWLSSTVNSWATSSDVRLKNVLGPIEGMCQKLKTVQPIFFEFKSDQAKTRKVGLLAQEVQAICPEIVTTDPEGWLGMAYQDAVPLLVSAIKELTLRIEALEGKSTRKSARK
jgi:hypothetical protein